MQFAHVVIVRFSNQAGEIEAEADFDVFLEHVIPVDQDFADLVGDVGVFALF